MAQAQAPERFQVRLLIEEEELVVEGACEEIKRAIIEAAKERGWKKVRVLVGGKPVSPREFCEALRRRLAEAGEEITIEIVRLDVAA